MPTEQEVNRMVFNALWAFMRGQTPALHVYRHARGWAIRQDGSKRASIVLKSRSGAIGWAARHAEGAPVYIHRTDGTVLRREGAAIEDAGLTAADLRARVDALKVNQARAGGGVILPAEVKP